jgi:hypothetical protein
VRRAPRPGVNLIEAANEDANEDAAASFNRSHSVIAQLEEAAA